MTRGIRQATWWSPVLVLGIVATLGGFSRVEAQSLYGFDPYRPYNGGYLPFTVPPPPMENVTALGQSRSSSYTSRSNEMNAFYDDLYGTGWSTSDQAGGGRSTFNRPSWYAKDDKFSQEQQRRDQAYLAALKERDPKKKRELLRAIEQEQAASLRALDVRRRPAPRAGAARPARPAQFPLPLPARGAGTTPAPGRGAAATTLPARGPTATTFPATGAPATAAPPMPATGRPTPAARARARTAPPASALPRTNRPRAETPSEIVNRALRSEPLPPPNEPVIPPIGAPNRFVPPR